MEPLASGEVARIVDGFNVWLPPPCEALMLRRGLAILCCPRCGTDAVVLSPWVPVQDKDGNQVAMWIIKLECPDCLLFRPMPISTRWEAVMKAPEIVRLTL